MTLLLLSKKQLRKSYTLKTNVAFKEFKKLNTQKEYSFVVAGGVAANKGIRKK